MNKQQIESHQGYKYIAGLTLRQRYEVLFGSQKSNIESAFNCKIEHWAFAQFGKVEDHMLALSVSDGLGTNSIAVLIPQ